MEIINDAQVEPRRLQAMLKLVSEIEALTKEDVAHLVQLPVALDKEKGSLIATDNVYKIAVDCNQICQNDDKTLSLLVPPESIGTMPAFQEHMQQVLLGVTEAQQSNYLFNLFSAWYAVHNERVLYELVNDGYDIAFNREMASYASTSTERLFNSTKFSGWRKWAEFLGLGWMMSLGNRQILIPDATKRVKAVVPNIFQDDRILSCSLFMERIAIFCPELDGGKLFNYCWQISRASEERGNRLSLMLSTALRTLTKLRVISLIHEADSLNVWHLYPAQGSPYQQVTHIHLQGA